MKTQSKQLIIFLCLLTIFLTPTTSFSSCNRPYGEHHKIEWVLDECGHWRPIAGTKVEASYYDDSDMSDDADP